MYILSKIPIRMERVDSCWRGKDAPIYLMVQLYSKPVALNFLTNNAMHAFSEYKIIPIIFI
jgi:hypothetical protein